MIKINKSKIYHFLVRILKPILPKFIFSLRSLFRNKIGNFLSKSSELINYKGHQLIEMQYSDYQPLPWINKKSFKRQDSTIARWESISNEINLTGGSAMDIGCNLGYFALSLAELGFFSIGIDTQPGFKIFSEHAVKKAGLYNATFSTMEISPDNIGSSIESKYFSLTSLPVDSLPTVDIIIFLSVWHHWIKAYGFDKASEMLQILWNKTNYALFFETGEDSEINSLGIQLEPAKWVENQLIKLCPGGNIKVLGQFDKGSHKDIKQNRTLFGIFKTNHNEVNK